MSDTAAGTTDETILLTADAAWVLTTGTGRRRLTGVAVTGAGAAVTTPPSAEVTSETTDGTAEETMLFTAEATLPDGSSVFWPPRAEVTSETMEGTAESTGTERRKLTEASVPDAGRAVATPPRADVIAETAEGMAEVAMLLTADTIPPAGARLEAVFAPEAACPEGTAVVTPPSSEVTSETAGGSAEDTTLLTAEIRPPDGAGPEALFGLEALCPEGRTVGTPPRTDVRSETTDGTAEEIALFMDDTRPPAGRAPEPVGEPEASCPEGNDVATPPRAEVRSETTEGTADTTGTGRRRLTDEAVPGAGTAVITPPRAEVMSVTADGMMLLTAEARSPEGIVPDATLELG